MRPCTRCGTALDNGTAVCPQCRANQMFGPKVNPSNPPPRRGVAHQAIRDVLEVLGIDLDVLAVFRNGRMLLVVLAVLAIGGFLGYAVGRVVGAVVGAIAAGVLLVAAKCVQEEFAQRTTVKVDANRTWEKGRTP